MPYARNQGVRIYYEVEGQGPPLVMMHGLTMGLNAWRHAGYVDALAERRQLILIDARGHGRSDKATDVADYAPAPLAGDVLAVLDHAALDRVDYFGYSYGAASGYVVGAQAPDRFRSLILGSMSAFAGEAQRRVRSQMRGILGSGPGLLVAGIEKTVPLPAALKGLMLSADPRALAAMAEAAVLWPDHAHLLPLITAHCLLYAGELDAHCPGARESAARIPSASFVCLPNIGHFDAFLRGDLILPHIQSFLAKIDEVGATRLVSAEAKPAHLG